MRKTIILILTMSLIGCAIKPGMEKVTEKKGDKFLKNQSTSSSSYFIGISAPANTEQEAIQSAKSNGITRILEQLGVTIEYKALVEFMEKSTEETTLTENKIYSVSEIVTSAFLKIRSDKTYVEKWQKNTDQGYQYFYIAYCGIPFSVSEYQESILESVNLIMNTYRERLYQDTQETSSGEYFCDILKTFFTFYQTFSELSDHTWLNQQDEYKQLKELLNEYRLQISSLSGKITITELKQPEKFTKFNVFTITFDNKTLPDFPITVSSTTGNNSATYISDASGKIILPEQLETREDTILSFTPGYSNYSYFLHEIMPPLERKVLSPLNPANINITILTKSEINERYMENKIHENLQKYGYKITPKSADFIIKINQATSLDEKSKYYPQKIAVATFSIKVTSSENNAEICSFNIPDDHFKDTRGFADNAADAYKKSLQLDNLYSGDLLLKKLADTISDKILEYIESEINE